jgi:hypothetical protein
MVASIVISDQSTRLAHCFPPADEIMMPPSDYYYDSNGSNRKPYYFKSSLPRIYLNISNIINFIYLFIYFII